MGKKSAQNKTLSDPAENRTDQGVIQKTEKKLKSSEKSVRRYQNFILRVIVILIVIWILFFKVIGLTHMPGEDMYPRVDAGDMVLFYRLDKNVQARDVIVIKKTDPDTQREKTFIARVVAVEGDTVEITESESLVINGDTQVEHNIFFATPPYEAYTQYPLTLGEDECFVLGDNRNGANDSRYFGAVNKKEIIGTVITILRRNNL